MSFRDEFRAQREQKVTVPTREVLVDVAAAMHDSIVNGSSVTGAPGQPVDTGNLKASWQLESVSPESARITTNVAYARVIEDGVGRHGPLTLRSTVGGFHSVEKTVDGVPALIQRAIEARRQ